MKSVALSCLLLAACYGAAPPKPARIPLPPPVEGAEITVHTEDRTELENVQKESSTCPQGHAPGSPECVVTRYTVKEPVTRTYSSMSYAEQPISYAQFKVMTDAQYDEKVSRLEDLAHKCKRANVPRYIGITGILVGLIGGPIAAKAGGTTAFEVTFYGGIAGGLASYTLGYFAFGGRDCNEARAIYRDVEVADEMGTTSVEGANLAAEMSQLAAKFNARRGQAAMRMREAP